MEKVAVKNAASEKQVKRAKNNDKFRRENELKDLSAVLETPEGRRVIWRFISHCNVFGTVMTGSAWTTYNSGKQDVGHFLMAEVIETDEEYLLKMMKENKKEKENMNV